MWSLSDHSDKQEWPEICTQLYQKCRERLFVFGENKESFQGQKVTIHCFGFEQVI